MERPQCGQFVSSPPRAEPLKVTFFPQEQLVDFCDMLQGDTLTSLQAFLANQITSFRGWVGTGKTENRLPRVHDTPGSKRHVARC